MLGVVAALIFLFELALHRNLHNAFDERNLQSKPRFRCSNVTPEPQEPYEPPRIEDRNPIPQTLIGTDGFTSPVDVRPP